MLRNLKAEMMRYGITAGDINVVIKKSTRTVTDKISGKYPFSMSEAIKIRDALFPGMALEYLFADSDQAS